MGSWIWVYENCTICVFFGKTIPVQNTKVNLKNKANMKVTLI